LGLARTEPDAGTIRLKAMISANKRLYIEFLLAIAFSCREKGDTDLSLVLHKEDAIHIRKYTYFLRQILWFRPIIR
jgi:hypothetical protein